MAIYNPPPTAVPTTHHTTHETGGADALTTVSAAIVNSGTLPDAQLSANVARRDQTNVFTATPHRISVANPQLIFDDVAQGTDLKRFRVINQTQIFRVDVVDDAVSTVLATPLSMTRAGSISVGADISEKGRTTPLGHWIDVPFNAANFSGYGGMTWTVSAGQVPVNRYTRIGKTTIWSLRVDGAAVGGTLTNILYLAAPVSLNAVMYNLCQIYSGGTTAAGILYPIDGATFAVQKMDTTAFASGATYVRFTIPVDMP